MIKCFYELYFKYIQRYDDEGDPIVSRIDIGVFSEKKKAINKRDDLKKEVGFNEHPLSCFFIRMTRVKVPDNLKRKSGIKLYSLEHEYEMTDGDEIIDRCRYFGYYFYKKEAIKDRDYLRKHTRYGKKYPEGFSIFCTIVDKPFPAWDEGFTSYDD